MTSCINDLTHDIQMLTSTIKDAQAKPALRDTLIVSLVSLGHPLQEAKNAVVAFYRMALN